MELGAIKRRSLTYVSGMDAYETTAAPLGALQVRYHPPELQKEIAAGPEIRNCNGCERDFARQCLGT
jgi:hypothetical protein